MKIQQVRKVMGAAALVLLAATSVGCRDAASEAARARRQVPVKADTSRSQAPQEASTQQGGLVFDRVSNSQIDINAASIAPQPSGANAEQAAANYISATVIHADKIWTKWLTSNGYQEPFVNYQIVSRQSGPYTSNCKNPTTKQPTVANASFPNAFFCAADNKAVGNQPSNGTIVLPVETMLKMWNGNIFERTARQKGDFAAATLVSHEFGHHITWAMYKQASTKNPAVKLPTGKNMELIADCFAGVWAVAVYKDGMLEAGDVEEAIAALEAIGDSGTGSDPHGTPAERARAWKVGYYGLQSNPSCRRPSQLHQRVLAVIVSLKTFAKRARRKPGPLPRPMPNATLPPSADVHRSPADWAKADLKRGCLSFGHRTNDQRKEDSK